MGGFHCIVGVGVTWVLCMSVLTADDYYSSSTWSLDPFLGSYDMIWAQQINMINFTGGIIGIPLAEVATGERQTFNKTIDGKYQQTVGRTDPRFDAIIVFELNKPGIVNIPNTSQTINYTFIMLNATTLQGTYEWNFGDRIADFTITFAFYPDASGFFDTVTLTKPMNLVATAPFYRVKSGDTGPITLGPS
ncbi:uncharacterized protein LOC129585366 [Paramacrobiotus metropolitanus]|uniref:uncharacterized protein LOC129585366 n=1 Tax=Paramacrobiotus metropolitanus TaxID=2943436 RepID=UPI0024464992|nr:uncharacterized protein LOC129585366 [Paramacrobiotus metropolitanus]